MLPWLSKALKVEENISFALSEESKMADVKKITSDGI